MKNYEKPSNVQASQVPVQVLIRRLDLRRYMPLTYPPSPWAIPRRHPLVRAPTLMDKSANLVAGLLPTVLQTHNQHRPHLWQNLFAKSVNAQGMIYSAVICCVRIMVTSTMITMRMMTIRFPSKKNQIHLLQRKVHQVWVRGKRMRSLISGVKNVKDTGIAQTSVRMRGMCFKAILAVERRRSPSIMALFLSTLFLLVYTNVVASRCMFPALSVFICIAFFGVSRFGHYACPRISF